MTEHLQLTPSELRFRFELRRNIPVTLSLHNPGSEPVAFKVKTTSPKKYCVRPSSGVVDPGSTKDVQVIMQAQREYPPSLADCKDKFLVQTCTVSRDVTEASPDIFESGSTSDIKHTKLRVVLLGPPKPPSPVPEGIEEDTPSPGKDKAAQDTQEAAGPRPTAGYDTGLSNHSNHTSEPSSVDVIALMQERNKLQDLLKQARQDNSSIKGKLDLLELQSRGPSSASQQTSSPTGGFTLLHLILVAVLAFVLGWFL